MNTQSVNAASNEETGFILVNTDETAITQPSYYDYEDVYPAEGLKNSNFRTSMIYLGISIFLLIGGQIYEHFSFGVYSNYMIFAFAIPLIGGALPFAIMHLMDANQKAPRNTRSNIASDLYHAAIMVLTVGSVIQGALAICGRPNSLTLIYLIAGILMIGASAFIYFKSNPIRSCRSRAA